MRTSPYRPVLEAVLLGLVLALGGCGGGGSADTGPFSPATPSPGTPAPPPAPAPGGAGDADGTAGGDEPQPASAAYEELFSLARMHTITIGITTTEWNALLNDFDANPRNEIFRQADFTYGEGDAAEQLANVGFRLRGNVFTRQRPEAGDGAHDPDNALQRVHFRIKFNEQFKEAESVYGLPSREIPTEIGNKDREFRTVRSLNLKYNRNDPTYTREVFSYDLFRRFGVATLRQAYTKLYVRIGAEEARYLGVYLMGEHVDKTWVQRRFGRNGFVFKSLYQGHGPADLAGGDRDHNIAGGRIGAEITDPAFAGLAFDAYRPAYDLKTKRRDFEAGEARLNDLIELLNGNPTRQMIEDAVDVDALLRAQAVNVFLGNWDDYWRNGNNYYLVLKPNDGRWLYVPYDYDIVLFDRIHMYDDIATAPFLAWGADRLSGNPVLMDKVLAFDDFRQRYADYVTELIDDAGGPASSAAISARLDELQAIVAPHVTGYDAIDSEPYRADLAEIADYVAARIATARAEFGAQR